MRIHPILLGILGAATQASCGTNCKAAGSKAFTVDRTLDADDMADFEQWWGRDTGSAGTPAADASCEELCRWASPGGHEIVVDACSHTVGTDTIELSCSGSTTYYCEGRRPAGHVDRATHARPGLPTTLAHFAELEAASIPAFEALADQLTRHDAPAELVQRCRDAAADERRHTVMMGRAARVLGASPQRPRQEDTPAPSLLELALHNATEGCVAETFAALLAHHHARHTTSARLRALFAPIARDETRHAQLAADLHAWFRSRLSPHDAQSVEDARRAALQALPAKARVLGQMLPPELGTAASDTQALATGLARALAA